MKGVADKIDDWFQFGVGPTTTVLSKTFVVNRWVQKIFLIKANQPVTVSILYTLNSEHAPSDSEFFPLSTASGASLPANTIIPFGVEDPVHFCKVQIETGAAASTDIQIGVFGSR